MRCIGVALLGFAMSTLLRVSNVEADDINAAALAGTSLQLHKITDRLGRPVTYYISRPKSPAPLLLMIQGSGCDPVLRTGSSGTYSTLYDLLPFAAEQPYAVIAVEKPFSGRDPSAQGGDALGCSATFNRDFTAESWLVALEAALSDARRLPWVDKRRALVLGFSEGAVMASVLASHDKQITDVAAIGGSGTTQLFDLIALAYRQCFDRSICLGDIDKSVQAIEADPENSTSFVWGHPFKRWYSFFNVDSSEELLRSTARVYLAFGTADSSVPALSEEVLVSKLLAARRDVTIRRIENAEHGLNRPEDTDLQALDTEYRAALKWFQTNPVATGVATSSTSH
jgi:dienelactone hydrolase